ncbi:MAG TPA: amino acid racemase [Steroidobacteraceae bacterium]
MKTIGLIGGLSWESTVPYYTLINQGVRHRLGGLHSAQLVLYSVDFEQVARRMHADDWPGAAAELMTAARALAAAGAEALILCSNTLHKIAPAIRAAIDIPLLHIVEVTAAEVGRAGVGTIGLLGTRFTMEQPFYAAGLLDLHGIRTVTPTAADRELLHRIIFDELCLGRLVESSRAECRRVMASLVAQGATGIVLGCTELASLIRPEDADVPLFDTTAIHARAAVDWSLSAD